MTSNPDRQNRIRRIQKLLDLARDPGATEHEAALALEKAQAQMAADGVTETDLLASTAAEHFTERGAARKVPKWEDSLAFAIGRTFGCDPIHHSGGTWSFVGIDPCPEIAGYAFDVLHRQCQKARILYIQTALKRVKARTNKTRRADLFCEGWIAAAMAKARAMARRPEDVAAIRALKATRYPNLTSLVSIDRTAGRRLRDYEERDRLRGELSGGDAELRVGVGLAAPPSLRIGRT